MKSKISISILVSVWALACCTPPAETLTPAPSATWIPSPTSTPYPALGTQVEIMQSVPPPVEVAEASSTKIWGLGGGVIVEEDLRSLSRLADRGYKIIRTILWWDYIPGYNLLDVYYNENIRHLVDILMDFHIQGYAHDGGYYGDLPGMDQLKENWAADPHKLWAVALDNEGPGGFRNSEFYGTLSEDVARYSEIYRKETGYTLKPRDRMTAEEDWVLREWLNEKTVWMYNYMYDYIKIRWPHLQIFQGNIMAPTWGFSYDRGAVYELKGDGFGSDCYYAVDNPWLLYESIRRYKTVIPDKPFAMWLWGVIWDFSQMEGGRLVKYRDGSLEQFRREAWISYLAGADIIGWFDWGPQDPGAEDWRWGWARTDPLGRQVYKYTGLLSRDLSRLPILKPQPVVLGVGEFDTQLPMPNLAEVGIFTEYDAINNRAFAMFPLNLSKYRLIVMAPRRLREETVAKLNAYVENGGNVIFLGGLNEARNIFDSGERESRLQIESRATESFEHGRVHIDIVRPNLLDLELEYEGLYHDAFTLVFDEGNKNYHPIGGIRLTNDDGTDIPSSGHSLVLYHDESKPKSGWILYWGVVKSSRTETAELANRSDLWFLYREVFRTFAEFLGIGDAVASPETEGLIITQSRLENGMLMAGIANLQPQERSFVYRVDLARFGLAAGDYWIFSLGEGATLGPISTNGTVLEIPLTVVANGTRLLVISAYSYEPGFRVNIFPEILPL